MPSTLGWFTCVHHPAGSNFPCKDCHARGMFPPPENKTIVGIGGAPIRASILPDNAKERKQYPVASGVLDYFPDAIAAVAHVSYLGNDQHNPGKPLHWDRSKSGDESDALMRHFMCRGTLDSDGVPHSYKLAWRALALLQKEIESEQKKTHPKEGGSATERMEEYS